MKIPCKYNQCQFSSCTKAGIRSHERHCKYAAGIESIIAINEAGNGKTNIKYARSQKENSTKDGCGDTSENHQTNVVTVEEGPAIPDDFCFTSQSNHRNEGLDEEMNNSEKNLNCREIAIDSIAVNLCLIEKKVGRRVVNELIQSLNCKDLDLIWLTNQGYL